MADSNTSRETPSGGVGEKEKKGEEPQYTLEYEDPCRVRITVEADAETLSREYEEQFETYRENAQLPGFRRGRAPKPMVERKFGDSVKQQVLYSAATEAYSEAVKEEGITVINELEAPDFENIQWEPGEPASFEFRCEVVPSVELKKEQYKGIEIDAPSKEVPQSVFESALESFARRFSEWNELDEKKEIDQEDSVQAVVKVLEPETEGELAESSFHFRPDQGRIGPFEAEGLKGAVVGCKQGDRVEVTAAVAEDVSRDDADPVVVELMDADQVRLELDIEKAYRISTPAIDDELAGKLGLENADEIREVVRSQVETDFERRRNEAIRSKLLSALLDRIELQLPESLVGQAAEENRRRAALDMWREGRDLEEVRKELAEEDLFEKEAERSLKVEFILKEIGELERIYVSEDEVDAHIRALAARRGMDEQRARRVLEKQDMLDSLRRDLRRGKIIDMLLENARINEVEWNEKDEDEKAE